MADKRFPAITAKRKPSRPVARKPLATRLLPAHSRLIHGFLVSLAPRQRVVARGAKTGKTPGAKVTQCSRLPSDTRHEGPADDATFH